jgi:CheY-like chemotaxis protein
MVLSQRATHSLAIENLSFSGARLAGALRIDPGERVKLFFHIDGERPLGMSAEIVRVEARALAVKFCDVDGDTRRRLEVLVRAAIDRQWLDAQPGILVVADATHLVASVTRDVGELAWAVVHAATSNDVIRLLEDHSVQYQAAVVDIALERVNTGALLRHLAEVRPHARRIVMAGPGHAIEADAEVSSGRAHAWLAKPWQASELRALI